MGYIYGTGRWVPVVMMEQWLKLDGELEMHDS